MNLIRTTALVAAAAAVAGRDANAANPVYYAPYSPAPAYVSAPAATPGYTTYCTPNGCYLVPVAKPNAYPAGSPCANGACPVGPSYVTPRTTPVLPPSPVYRPAPAAPSNGSRNPGSSSYYRAPSTSPVVTAPQASPFYSEQDAATPARTPAAGNRVSTPTVKTPSQSLALGNRPSPFYP